jgi:hypothetical protein
MCIHKISFSIWYPPKTQSERWGIAREISIWREPVTKMVLVKKSPSHSTTFSPNLYAWSIPLKRKMAGFLKQVQYVHQLYEWKKKHDLIVKFNYILDCPNTHPISAAFEFNYILLFFFYFISKLLMEEGGGLGGNGCKLVRKYLVSFPKA